MITHQKIRAELRLALAKTDMRLHQVTEQMNRQGVLTSSARRLRIERDQLIEERQARLVLIDLADGVHHAVPGS